MPVTFLAEDLMVENAEQFEGLARASWGNRIHLTAALTIPTHCWICECHSHEDSNIANLNNHLLFDFGE